MSQKWTEYVVGEEGCAHYKVVNAMLNSKANSVFFEKWSAFAMNLNLDYGKIKKWRKDVLLDKIEIIQPLLHEIIEEWTATTKHPKRPTLSVLIKALSDAGLNDMANETRKAFEQTVDVDNQQEPPEDPTQAPAPTSKPIETKQPTKNQPIPELIPAEELDFLKNETPFKVEVTRPAKAMKISDDDYNLPPRFKGYALIINITKFLYPTPNRDGASNDTKYMSDLWTQLGYDPIVHEGEFNETKIDEIVKDFIKKLADDEDEVRSCVVFIGSHGVYGKIILSDGVAINLYQNFIYRIAKCDALKGKPKLFIIQACQEFESRTGHDNVPERKLEMPVDDMVVCFPTIPGTVSKRDIYLGTWFIYVLTRVFMKNAHQMDFEEMFKQVIETMRYLGVEKDIKIGQLPYPQPFGLKKLYFNMKPKP